MSTHAKSFPICLIAFWCWALINIQTAQAMSILHSEAHVLNFQINSTGSLAMNPWLNIAAAGAFDDPSGWSQVYDDDPGATGQAFASAATAYASAQSVTSSNLLTIDVSGDLNNSTNNFFAMNAYSYGELYTTFQVSGDDLIEATFSLDWAALLSGQSSLDQSFYADYAIQLLVSDGATYWSREAFNTLSGSGAFQSITNSGTLSLTLTLQPDVLYSLDILAHPNDIIEQIPEPPVIALIFGAGFLTQRFGFFRRKSV